MWTADLDRPQMPLRLEGGLQIGQIAVAGGFAEPANRKTISHLAEEVGRLMTEPAVAREFGLVSPRDPVFAKGYALPAIESIRIARRAGPDKQITVDLVAEITQERMVPSEEGASYPFFGGATLIIDSFGDLRFSIRKRVDHSQRQKEQWQRIRDEWGARFWKQDGTIYRPTSDLARRLCARSSERS